MKEFLKYSLKYSCLLAFCLVIFCSCSSKSKDESVSFDKTNEAGELIYEETISPNKDYVTSTEDAVEYTMQVFQDKDRIITVAAKSNSAFSRKLNILLIMIKQFLKMKWI